MDIYRKLISGAIVGVATFLGGCHSVQNKDALQLIPYHAPAIVADTSVQSVAPIQTQTPSPQTIEISTPIDDSITLERQTDQLTPERQNPQPSDDNIPLELSLLPTWRTIPCPQEFSLNSVTYELRYERIPSPALPNIPLPDTDFINRYEQALQRESSNKFGLQEVRIVWYAAREIIREMAYSHYHFMIHANRFLGRLESIGEKLRAIERGIQDIYTINFGNIEEEFTDPLAPLKRSLGVESTQTTQRQSRINIEGTLEPTLGGHPFGSRTGQDLADILHGTKEADLGFQFRLQIDF